MCTKNLQNKQDLFLNRDHRPQLLGWAPGCYERLCYRCEKTFFGDKRAIECAQCAYLNPVNGDPYEY